MTSLRQSLVEDGICLLPPPFPPAVLAEINRLMDAPFGAREDEKRAYIRIDEMVELGLFDQLFAPPMLAALFAIMPDPVLYHCHAYEIAAQQSQPHIFADSLLGFHRDPDSEWVPAAPSHVSLFLYLTDVGPGDGAFEFIPSRPLRLLRPSTPVVTMTGPAGTCFLWHRNFYHRASPNQGQRRRRLLKLSIQHNSEPNPAMATPPFQRLAALLPPGDPAIDLLVGRYLGQAPPAIPAFPEVAHRPPEPARKLGIPQFELLNRQLRERVREVKRFLKGRELLPVGMTDARMTEASLRILLIGAGYRIKDNFLPALTLLGGGFEIAGIHSRTTAKHGPLAARWGVPAVPDLAAVDFDGIDAVAVSVPTAQNAVVLNRLAPFAPKLTLLIDTPVAWNARELAAVLPGLARFRQVLVTEDFMNFPPFQLLRRAVADGLVGKPRGLTLFNTGFLYHGLALLRSFVDFAAVRRTRRIAVGSFSAITSFGFGGGFGGCMVGPYRQHGGLTLEGTRAIVTDQAVDRRFGNAAGRPVHELETRRDGAGLIAGFDISDTDGRYRLDLPDYAAMTALDFDDKTELNILRGLGLMEVFRALRDPANLNHRYGWRNALYDSQISQWAERGRLPFDPLTWMGRDMLDPIMFAAKLRG